MNDPRNTFDARLERIHLLASDYDGTLAHHGNITETTADALRAAKRHGLKLALITGREFDDLLKVCPYLELFDFVVAEDGGVLYFPAKADFQPLVDPPPAQFIKELTRRRIPFSRGRVIVSTAQSYAEEVEAIMAELELGLHTTLNKGSAMYLPRGTDKGSGLMAGLHALGMPADAVAGFGDAENDLAFLRLCGVSVAVANALEAVKAHVDIVQPQGAGEGVAAFIREHLLVQAPS